MQRDPEYQYLDLLAKLLEEGDPRMDRTGVGTRALFGEQLRFDLSDGSVPLMTTKKVMWRAAIAEMLWFLSGETNIRPLLLQGVRIWSDWPHAKYLEKTGSSISKEEFERLIVEDEAFAEEHGDLGPVYGFQWRRWPTPNGPVDQVQNCIDLLKKDPYSRRILFHAWNVADLPRQALPPCHVIYQFGVIKGRLNMALFQRSVDSWLGLVWNLLEGAVLVRMVAQQTGLEPGEFQWFGADTHLYENHVEAAKEQLRREPRGFPKLVLKRHPDSIDDYRVEDFEIIGYDPHGPLRAPVAV